MSRNFEAITVGDPNLPFVYILEKNTIRIFEYNLLTREVRRKPFIVIKLNKLNKRESE
jgi:hypothetical protein